MMLRSIGRAVRGKASPPQLFAATLLGSLLGFVPGSFLPGDVSGGFMQAPALILGLLALVVLLNANLIVFASAAVLAKVVSIFAMPVAFAVGRFLLDGPAEGLAKSIVNAPVLAWAGVEYYATTGGLVLGLAFGVVLAVLRHRLAAGFRARAEAGGARSTFDKLIGWILVGQPPVGVTAAEHVATNSRGWPLRPLGVVFVVVFGLILWVGQSLLNGPMLRGAAKRELERWNGATVDLEQASVDLTDGKVVIAGLGMTDYEALSKNLFEARTLELQVDTSGLLAKRLIVETVTSREASSGTARKQPGKIVHPRPEPPEPPADETSKTLEDYLSDAAEWQGRLQQLGEWLEQVVVGDGAGTDEAPESRDERVAREVEELGPAHVVATHLFDEVPALLVKQVVFEGVSALPLGDGESLDIHASNLSTSPALVAEPMSLSIKSRSQLLSFELSADPSKQGAAMAKLDIGGILVDSLTSELRDAPIRGGTLDLSLSGELDFSRPDGVWLDLPLNVTLNGTTLAIPGVAETPVERLALPIGLRGPLAAPSVSVDESALADALTAAGRAELANQVRSHADALLGDTVPGVGNELSGVIEGSKTPEQVLEEARKKAEEEAAKKAAEEANKLLPGLFGGKKKDG